MNAELYSKEEIREFQKRSENLVRKMTLTEKVSQMLHGTESIERLDIPSYNWWNESLHGVARAGVATMFPQAIGLAATFDEALLKKTGDIISTEGRAKYHEFQREKDHDIYKGLTFWAPNINIFRDPRWGRGQETFGEDPYLSARLGIAMIKGLQGTDPKYLKSAACVKHFAVHSGPESLRHEFDAIVSEKDLWETYLPAFKECVEEGEVAGVMGAYNRVNGEPCCGSERLLRKILREDWHFDGYVTSDCWAIRDFNEGHNVTKCLVESSALAVKNGCDLNCGCAYANLIKAVSDGLISEKEIDTAVVHLMTIRMRLGLFDAPEKVPYTSIGYEYNDCAEHRAFSLEVAQKSLVLLKNDQQLLPLNRTKLKSIAVIGPNADSRDALTGNYCGTASEYVTIVEGIREAAGQGTRVYYAEGCHLWKDRVSTLSQADDRIAEAVSAAKMADVSIVCLGLNGITLEGEQGDTSNEFASGDKNDLCLPRRQQKLLEAICAVGKPVILVLLSGSALAVTWADSNVPSIIQAWYPGGQGGRAVASAIFGEYCFSGRLPVTFYKSAEELPDFCDYSMENRTYRYMKNEALYPFGYGLSYTKFAYSALALHAEEIMAGQSLTVTAAVQNIGEYAAEETAQIYLRDVSASVRVPNWQLAGIRKLYLQPGETAQLQFTITPRQMALIDEDGKCILEPGEFQVFVGTSQPDSRSVALTGMPVLSGAFQVVGNAS